MITAILAASSLSWVLLVHVGWNCGSLKRLKVSFDNPPCLSCRHSPYEWLLQVQKLVGAKTTPGRPSGVLAEMVALNFCLFNSLLATLSFLWWFCCVFVGIRCTPFLSFHCSFVNSHLVMLGFRATETRHCNQRFSGHVLQGTVSIIAWEHEGFVESVKTIMPYLSDIFQ